MARLMHLLKIKVFATKGNKIQYKIQEASPLCSPEIAFPDLAQQRLTKVEKFRLEVIFIQIRIVWMEIFICNPIYITYK
jgi:hypothetical protein